MAKKKKAEKAEKEEKEEPKSDEPEGKAEKKEASAEEGEPWVLPRAPPSSAEPCGAYFSGKSRKFLKSPPVSGRMGAFGSNGCRKNSSCMQPCLTFLIGDRPAPGKGMRR